MSAIVIRADKKSNKILSELAKKLGGSVIDLKDEQYEDIAPGSMMDEVKTNETVDKETIIEKSFKNIFKSFELNSNSVTEDFSASASDGKNYKQSDLTEENRN